ncbi:MAG: very short patch repair endonuclease [Endozoicomonas sp.]|uniref:very short patch repair endonuclease n=1 Tax=Endozoicomonas sp. TaxID=1892382 RepID=UPI003D9B2651
MDIVSQDTRSRMMSGIRSKDTKPEILIRKALHARGFRFRLHARDLPGKPDLVFPKYRAVIQINGCFWHGHNCHLFKWPSSRPEFWREKIGCNRERDVRNVQALQDQGWRVMILWECALKGKTRLPFDQLTELVENWLLVGNQYVELTGV